MVLDKELIPNLETKTDQIIDTLTKKLEKLELKMPSTSSQNINTIDISDISNEEDVKKLERIFQVEDTNKDIYRIQRAPLTRPKTRNYYP